MEFSAKTTTARRVMLTNELTRIAGLRRRVWTTEEGEEFAERLTHVLKTPQGQMRLRPVQAISLFELAEVGGVFGPQRCGAGKTLLSLLAPSVLQRVKKRAYRPLLVVPAGLLEKTERDRRLLAEHWEIASFLKVMSYEWLGRPQAAEALQEYQPDLIILDECHKLKNGRSAVCRRFKRFFQERSRLDAVLGPGGLDPVLCIAMSGTVTKRSLFDYAHIMRWCLPASHIPIPWHFQDLMDWADALDEKKERKQRDEAMTLSSAKSPVVVDPVSGEERTKTRFNHGDIDPGELKLFCNTEETAIWDSGLKQRAARLAFRRRLIETPGVVATVESPIDASLLVRGVKIDEVGVAVEDAFEGLRTDWVTPDGVELWDGLEVARKAKELAIGFYYVWRPSPPKEWLEPRKVWAKFVRETLKHSKTLDSESQVRRWVQEMVEPPKMQLDLGKEPRGAKPCHWTQAQFDEACAALLNWVQVRDTFEPNTVPVWIDTTVLNHVASWCERHRGIVWVEHTCFGERLEKDFGITYYGRKGRNIAGSLIDDHSPSQSLVASIAANKEGRNLQAWSENLIVSMPSSGLGVEQLISRTHRDGQDADQVSVEVIVSCFEHVDSFNQASADADYIQSSTGSPQKLMQAGIDFPQLGLLGFGRRWVK